MTPKMKSDFVRAQIEESLEIYASSAVEQRRYLERSGSPVSVDELALKLEDFIVMVPAAVRDGVLSQEQANAI
jgi:hypothetical protein